MTKRLELIWTYLEGDRLHQRQIARFGGAWASQLGQLTRPTVTCHDASQAPLHWTMTLAAVVCSLHLNLESD